MSSNDAMAERRDVFQGHDGPGDTFVGEGFAMRLVPPATRFSLRMDAALIGAAGRPGGFDLGQPINALRETGTAQDGSRLSARLGPDEWLLIASGTDDDADPLGESLASDLGATAHTLVDVSHRNIAIELIGDGAADVLNTGCPLDLGDRAFPVGTATRTLFSKTEIVLLRMGPDYPGAGRDDAQRGPLWRVECWRSFGRYLYGHLDQAAQLIGVRS